MVDEKKKAYYNTRKPFRPVAGKWYENEGGGIYLCLDVSPWGTVTMQHKTSRWTFEAVGIGVYEDGKIDWDYSRHGFYAT